MPEPIEELLLPLAGLALLLALAIAVHLLRRDHAERREAELAVWSHAADEDTYRAAAAELDSGDVALELPAIRTLEQLATASIAFRQPAVDLLCGYLRRPAGCEDDQVARRAAQLVITHLAAAATQHRWQPFDLDLTGATLTDLDLSGAHLKTIDCTNAELRGETTLHKARILGPTRCRGAVFTGPLRSDDVDYEALADFSSATFHAEAAFGRCTFRREANFIGATFLGPVRLGRSIFLGAAVFSHPVTGPARFHGVVDFRGARFKEAVLADVSFPGGIDLIGAEFIRRPPPERLHPALRAAFKL